MKKLFPKTSSKPVGKSQSQQGVAKKDDVQAFLQKVAAMPRHKGSAESEAEARLVFALDATASRQQTWDQASQLQGEMFVSTQSLGGLQVQLCYFRGLGDFYDSPWHSDPDQLLGRMTGIQCLAGMTQIRRLLKHVIQQNSQQKIRGVIYIGDAMEENKDDLCELAGKLGILNVPLFIFQERDDPVAGSAFREMARLSGGAYCHFDSSSADQLKDLLKAVAIYAAGGLQALEDFSKTSHKSVKLLGQQLK